jgi:hypothetical protein
MTDVGIVGFGFVWCVELMLVNDHSLSLPVVRSYMGAEHFRNILTTRTYPYPRTCNTFPHKPIPAIECGRSSIQRIAHHIALFERPSGQDHQTSAKYAAVVELSIRQEMFRLLPYDVIILLRPTFLQTDNVWSGVRGGDLVANFFQSLIAKFGDKLEAPAIM